MAKVFFPLSSGPENSTVTSAYGIRRHSQNNKIHKGIDLTQTSGDTPQVLPSEVGTVYRQAYDGGGWGNYVCVRGAGSGYYFIYAHMAQPSPWTEGRAVPAAAALGIMGSTGNSTGPHLHFEIRNNFGDSGSLIDPAAWLGIANIEGPVKAAGRDGAAVLGLEGGGAVLNIPYEEMTPVAGTAETGEYLYGRRVRVVVSDDNGAGAEISDLRIMFQCVKSYLPSELQYSVIQVYNLNRETESFIIRAGSRVTVEAGYIGDNFGLIFDGDIVQAMGWVEEGTDFVLKIVAVDGDRFLTEGFINTVIPRGMTQRQAAEAVAGRAVKAARMGTVTDGLTPKILPRGKAYFGMAKDYLAQIARASDAAMYMDGGEVKLIKVSDPPEDRIYKLTPASGLLGLPQQTNIGIRGKALLIPQIRCGRSIQIENQYIAERQAAIGSLLSELDKQGVYRVAKATYNGDTRGVNWYVEFEAMAQAGYLPAILTGQGNPW
jgi:hypothetical protein